MKSASLGYVLNITKNGYRPLTAWMRAEGMMNLRCRVGTVAYNILLTAIHGATAELARLGLNDNLIMPITNHKAHQMVQGYAGAEGQKLRANAVNIACESGYEIALTVKPKLPVRDKKELKHLPK